MARIIKADQLDEPAAAKMTALKLRELAVHASEIVLDARKQAARILSEARDQAKLLELQAEEKGYREGFQRGKQAGYAAGEKAAYEQVAAGMLRQGRGLDGAASPGTYEPIEPSSETDGGIVAACAENMEGMP